MADPGVEAVALPIVPCPDCGRNVMTYVARRGQNAGQRFYKCWNHNVGRGVRGACGDSWTSSTCSRANRGSADARRAGGWSSSCAGASRSAGAAKRSTGGVQAASFASAVAGYMLAAAPVAGRQGPAVYRSCFSEQELWGSAPLQLNYYCTRAVDVHIARQFPSGRSHFTYLILLTKKPSCTQISASVHTAHHALTRLESKQAEAGASRRPCRRRGFVSPAKRTPSPSDGPADGPPCPPAAPRLCPRLAQDLPPGTVPWPHQPMPSPGARRPTPSTAGTWEHSTVLRLAVPSDALHLDGSCPLPPAARRWGSAGPAPPLPRKELFLLLSGVWESAVQALLELGRGTGEGWQK
ncbi:uncharacterized protein [Triticum aestivum]|uniref:uncharacterized protein isoform X1 n=1 Tax=Triticum aestivum TaxID=4565 RepID=UPI001D022C9F|nr:uncharacterized protein LOC123052060 isoform X1 [Triticum aestivum]